MTGFKRAVVQIQRQREPGAQAMSFLSDHEEMLQSKLQVHLQRNTMKLQAVQGQPGPYTDQRPMNQRYLQGK